MTARLPSARPATDRRIEPRRNSAPRAPRRERGVQRYGELLDALEVLLETNHPDDIGIYQIAEQAKAPPASTYHFFPTKEAAFVALAERHLRRFRLGMHLPVPAAALAGWLDLLAYDSRESVRYFNSHPAALKLVIGRYGGLRVREVDIEYNRSISRAYVDRLKAAFDMPDVADSATRFHTMLEIQDAVWAISYASHGTITPEYEREAIRASRAYIRLYFPEEIALTEEIRLAIAGGEPLILPRGWAQANAGGDTQA